MTKPSSELRIKIFERLAEQLRKDGATNPIAATVALAARGDFGLTATEFSLKTGISPEHLESFEQGDVELPAILDVYDEWLPDDIDRLLTNSIGWRLE